jgi:hypothetical protein
MPKCLRCGREFKNPVPKIRNISNVRPELLHYDIACVKWCANCNRVAMSGIFRNNSAYFDPNLPFDGMSESTYRSTEEG